MLEDIRNGNPAALDALLTEEWSGLVGFLVRIVGDTAEAEDSAQEAFVRLWANRERWQEGTARAVLYRIGRNHALDQVRKRKVRAATPLESAGTLTGSDRPDEDLEVAELGRRVQSAIANLPAKRREVFELVRFHGMSYAEVADVLGRSAQTVANHMSLALNDLRTMLAADLSPTPAAERESPSGQEEQSDG